jgi:hypothetical protein
MHMSDTLELPACHDKVLCLGEKGAGVSTMCAVRCQCVMAGARTALANSHLRQGSSRCRIRAQIEGPHPWVVVGGKRDVKRSKSTRRMAVQKMS